MDQALSRRRGLGIKPSKVGIITDTGLIELTEQLGHGDAQALSDGHYGGEGWIMSALFYTGDINGAEAGIEGQSFDAHFALCPQAHDGGAELLGAVVAGVHIWLLGWVLGFDVLRGCV